MTEHWLDKANRNKQRHNLEGHINRPRISAENIMRLVRLKNRLLGTNNSVYEASLIAEENAVI